jgi:UDP-glucose 4-epimerase
MRILVTGANGFIGFGVCRLLLERGHQVVALWHHRRERLDTIAGHPSLQVEKGDVIDQAHLAVLCARRQIEALCHLAIQPPQALGQVYTQGTLSALEAGVGRVVFVSSMSVYNFLAPRYLPVDEHHPLEPLQGYGSQKALAETYCHTYRERLEVPILRLAGVYGPGKKQGAAYQFTKAALCGLPIEIPSNRSVDLLFVGDAAAAVVAAAEGQAGSDTYNIGSGRALALDELARLICRQQQVEIPITCGPSGNTFYLDISRAREHFGFAPRPLEEGLACLSAWVKTR